MFFPLLGSMRKPVHASDTLETRLEIILKYTIGSGKTAVTQMNPTIFWWKAVQVQILVYPGSNFLYGE